MNRIEENKEFYAPVRMEKAELSNPNFAYMSYNSSIIIVTHPELGEVAVNNCSDGYGLIPTYHIFPQIEKELEKEFSIAREYQVKNVAKFYANYTIKNCQISVKEDKLEPFIRIQHSYNGKLGFSAYFGFYHERLEIYLYGGSFTPISLSHTEGNVEKIIEDTMISLGSMIKEMNDLTSFQEMSSKYIKKADLKDFIEEIVKETKYYTIQDSILEFVQEEMGKLNLKQANLWTIYTSMMYLLGDEEFTAQPENKVALDIKVFNYLLKNI